MYRYIQDHPRQLVTWLLTAVAGFVLLLLWQAHQGFSLWDEGFLWYGAQRVLAGEVPLRDFMAYDIGRYYWSAAFMGLMGDNGVVALRIAATIFEMLALCVGLVMLRRSSIAQPMQFWVLAAITLVAWMAPQYRVFDISLPILLIGGLAFLVERPTQRNYFLAGLIVGLVAVFGRNHGLYGVVGSLAAMLYLAAKRDGPGFISAFPAWLAGMFIGYLPVLAFLVFVPGFAQAYWESIRFLFEIRATNIPLPIPWPWLVPYSKLPVSEMLSQFCTGMFFIAIVAFGLLGLVWLFRQRLQNRPVSPVLVASICLMLPYAHYAYSRADLEHLAPGIPPSLIGMLALLAGTRAAVKWSFAALLCGASLSTMLPAHPWWACHTSLQCADFRVGKDKLSIDAGTTDNLVAIGNLAARFAPGNRSFVVTPFWPGAYAVLDRKSPMWEIYALFPRSVSFQQAEIERIKAANPGFIMIYDLALDGRDDLRFRNTHPLIDQYIRDNYDVLNITPRITRFRIYISRQPSL